jgi:hypothetical protein
VVLRDVLEYVVHLVHLVHLVLVVLRDVLVHLVLKV